MRNYDICKDINEFYFNNYASLALLFPAFFPEGTEEGKAIQAIQQQIAQGQYDAAAATAQHCLQHFPKQSEVAFIGWQLFARWHAKAVANSELVAYFDQLEKAFPAVADFNFNKAALHVRDKQFNKAVKELQKARAKNPGHGQAVLLLFWIYYFSHDAQWRELFKLITDNKVLPEHITGLVSVAESLADKKETPRYLFADKGDLHKANAELLEKFPALTVLKGPDEAHVLFLGVDGGYLREYAVTFFLSALDLPRTFGIHIHLYNPMGDEVALLKQYDEQYPQLKLSYSYEKGSFALKSGEPVYFASMRFCRAYQLRERFPGIQRIAVMDADVVLRKDPFDQDGVRDAEIVVTAGPEIWPAWDRIIGWFTAFSDTETGRQGFAYLANVLLKNFVARSVFWFIDQVALFDMYQHFQPTKKVRQIGVEEQRAHTDKAAFWTYTNEQKLQDNPMNRERQRLLQQYGITQEWNAVAKGKYGMVVANRNDEYIGRSLLTNGAWCDHEIAILQSVLDFDDTVLEIGANIGSHTLPLAKCVGGGGRIIAIEPQRLLFQTLCANLAVNSVRNAYVLNIGIGEQEGEFLLSELDPTVHQNFGGYRPKEHAGETVVPVRTIDSLKLDACKVIKMDIEGMELEALKGAQETLRAFEPVVFFESHGDAAREIAQFLKGFGYSVYDFAIPNDPMFLAVTQKHAAMAEGFNIAKVEV